MKQTRVQNVSNWILQAINLVSRQDNSIIALWTCQLFRQNKNKSSPVLTGCPVRTILAQGELPTF